MTSDDYIPTARRFVGKVVVVTGAGSGIGWETARRFAAEGARVAALDLKRSVCDSLLSVIVDEGGEAMAVAADVRDEASAAAAIDHVLGTWGRIDVLVNNAGRAILTFASETTVADWDDQAETNLRSVFVMSRTVWGTMVTQGHGVILNASSISASWAMFAHAAYAAAKAGIASATRVMAIEGGRSGIRVNSVSPGYILTPGFQNFINSQTDPTAFHDAMAGQSTLGRMGTPGDIAEAYLYLASDAAAWVTGTDFVIDGGITAGQLPDVDPRARE